MSGDPVVATWRAEDVHVLSKVDSGEAGDPYLDHGTLMEASARGLKG